MPSSPKAPTIAQQARQAQIEVEDEVEVEVEVGTQAAPARNTRLGVRYSVDLDLHPRPH